MNDARFLIRRGQSVSWSFLGVSQVNDLLDIGIDRLSQSLELVVWVLVILGDFAVSV